MTFATRLAASSKIKCNIPKGGAVNVAGLRLDMGEEDGSCRHCRALSLPRGDACRSRPAKPWKCRTARDGRWHTEPNRAMPWKSGCMPRSDPVSQRPSLVSTLPRPRCAAASIPGTAPVRHSERKIPPAPSSQGLSHASASWDFTERLPRRALSRLHIKYGQTRLICGCLLGMPGIPCTALDPGSNPGRTSSLRLLMQLRLGKPHCGEGRA